MATDISRRVSDYANDVARRLKECPVQLNGHRLRRNTIGFTKAANQPSKSVSAQ